MAHQIALTDEDYTMLAAASAQTGEPIATLVHEAIAEHFMASPLARQIGSYQYPTGESMTPEELAKEEELAQSIGSERPWASEIVIEDRGPR